METITTAEKQATTSIVSNEIAPTTGITLNILEIIPSKETVLIYSTPFRDYAIKGYRNKFKQHYFHRNGNTIYAWSLVPEPELSLPDEFQAEQINRIDHTLTFNKILESSLEYLFKSKGRDIYKPKYLVRPDLQSGRFEKQDL